MGLPPLLSLQGIYQDAYNAIVKPEQKFAVSHYFWKRWGPLLGPAGTWFIIALRQRCFWNERQDWCVVDSDTLAREAALSRRSLFRLLEGEGFLSWFFRREKRRQYNRRAGRYVLSPNLYIVRLDDPLVPADQAGLASLIHQNVLCLPNSAQVIMDFLSYLSKEKEFPFPEELAEEVHLSGKSFTVYEVVKEVLPEITRLGEEEKVRLRKICSELQNKITQPERVYLGTQYFRLKWLPRLGHTLASFIVALRTRCYWNEKTGELRDTIEVSLEEIAPEIGCTSRWLRNLRHQRFSLLFFEEIGQGLFRVQMRDPLTPEDQVLFEKMTASSPSQIDPQTGQLSALPLLEQTQAQSEEKNVPETGQNFWHIEPDILALRSGIFGTQKRNFWHLEGIPVEILEPEAEFLALRNGIFGT